MFTDRFIKVPISVYGIKEKELTGNENLSDSWLKFLPLELAAYRPASSNEDYPELEDCTSIILKNGDITVVNMPPKEFEEELNWHFKTK